MRQELNREVWGVCSNLHPNDQLRLINFDSLPAGEVAKIIRKVEPMFQRNDEGSKTFKITVKKKITIYAQEFGEVEIKADSEEHARQIFAIKKRNSSFIDKIDFDDRTEYDEDDDGYEANEVEEIDED